MHRNRVPIRILFWPDQELKSHAHWLMRWLFQTRLHFLLKLLDAAKTTFSNEVHGLQLGEDPGTNSAG